MKEKSPVKMQNVVGSFPHSWSCVVDCLCRAVNQVDDDHDHCDEYNHQDVVNVYKTYKLLLN